MSSGGRLPNTTSISLHERFSKLRTSAGGQRLTGKAQGSRKNAAVLQKAASKNSRLTQQMDRRNASLSAALKIKKKSIKQRLGNKTAVTTGAKFRGSLTQSQRRLPGARGAKTPIRGAKSPVRGARRQIQTAVLPARGGRPTRGAIRGAKRGGRGAPVKKVVVQTPTKSPRGRGGRGQKSPAVVQVQRGRGRGQRGGRGSATPRGRGQPTRGRGQNTRGRGGKPVQLSKEDLDKQLDQYMSKTRNALDKDLETYMSSVGDVEMK